MEKLIKKIEKEQIVFSKKDIKKVIIDFENEFEKSIPQLIEKINQDYKVYNMKIRIEELREQIQQIKNEPNLITEEIDGNEIIDGIGTIVTIFNGKPNITINMILNSIKTHNKIILCAENEFKTSKFIVEIMKHVLKNSNYSEYIVNIISDYDDIYDCQEYIDKVIFIGNKYDYINLRKKLYVDTEYNGYGYITLFYDNKECLNSLQNMKMFALNNMIEIDVYNDNLEETIKKINYLKLNQTAVIFSKEKSNIIKSIVEIKASKIYVNKNPLSKYKFEISQKSLIKNKKIM